jgi:hypothetical protein
LIGKQNGFVLVVVLWVLAILTVAILGFGRRAMIDAKSSAYALDHSQAMMMARGAVRRGMQELYLHQYYKYETARTVDGIHLGQAWALQTNNLMKSGECFEQEDFRPEDGAWYQIEDLGGYINVNEADRALLREILPIKARRYLETKRNKERIYNINELRYLGGITPEEWNGTPGNPGVKDLLTTWGGSRVNVNTAPRAVLECIPKLDHDHAVAIEDYRGDEDARPGTSAFKGFKGQDDMKERLGATGQELAHCTTSSQSFKITGIATRRNGKIRALCSAVVSRNGNILAWQEGPGGS